MKKKVLNKIINLLLPYNGWINILGSLYGEEVVKYAEQYHDNLLQGLSEAEKYYYTQEMPKVREQLKQFREENKNFAKECEKRRKEENSNLLEEKKNKLSEMLEHRGNIAEKEKILKEAEQLEKIIKSEIDDSLIEKAREFPLERLLEINQQGFAKCINHDDTNPSMFCKKNYVYCFSCNYTTDSIGVFQKINNCDFISAVKFLTSSL